MYMLGCFQGSQSFDAPANVVGRIKLSVITEGCSLFFEAGEKRALVFSGAGEADLVIASSKPPTIYVVADAESTRTTLLLPWTLEVEPKWAKTASFVQLETSTAGTLSPEVADMFRRIQENAMQREAALRAEIQRLAGRS